MKILKLLVTSILMSAMLISCSGGDDATSTTGADTTTPAVEAPAEATPEVEATEETTEDAVELNEEVMTESPYTLDMTDEEMIAVYTDLVNQMVEDGDVEAEDLEIMIAAFNPDFVRATLSGEEIDMDALLASAGETVEALEEALENAEEATEEEAEEESAE